MALAILLLLLSVLLIFQTDWMQTRIARTLANRLSKDLGTEVAVEKVSLGLFKNAELKGLLIRDQASDTLLYAGSLSVNYNNWFFLGDVIDIHEVALEDATIYLHRKDSIWNYQFLDDYFSSDQPKTQKKKKQWQLVLRRIDLKHVHFYSRDEWIGEDITFQVTSLECKAKKIDLKNKVAEISSLVIAEPGFRLRDYAGNRPAHLKPVKQYKKTESGNLQWNTGGWKMLVERFSMKNGRLQFDTDTERAFFDHFDPLHLDFRDVTGTITRLELKDDTLSGKIDLQSKERSGFQLDKLKANLSFHPEAMIFRDLKILTPNSRIGDYYVMRYDRFKQDMNEFVSQVTLDAAFRNSKVSLTDIAFFAPQLRGLDQTLTLDGYVSGKVDNFSTKGLNIRYGKSTTLSGELTMQGLPETDKTRLEFTNVRFSADLADLQSLVPGLKEIRNPELTAFQYFRYNGKFDGSPLRLHSKGMITTAIGKADTDLSFIFAESQQPAIEGTIQTEDFQLGRLLALNELGNLTASATIKANAPGTGESLNIEGKIKSVQYKGYDYHDIRLNGQWKKKGFSGTIDVNDLHAKASINGTLQVVGAGKPKIDVFADLEHLDLYALHLSQGPIRLKGRARIDMLGDNLDDMEGEMAVYDVAVKRDQEEYAFDTLFVRAGKRGEERSLEMKNADLSISMQGKYRLTQVPQALKGYLSNYYPSYFDKPTKPSIDQEFRLSAKFQNIEPYIGLLDRKLTGFNYSSIDANVNTANRLFELKANIPIGSYGKYRLEDFLFDATGDRDSLRMESVASKIVINDSLEFPTTKLSVLAAGGVSDILLSTSANQTIHSANLSAQLVHLSDGIKILFRPSTVVINEKTWRIDQGGEITISKSVVDATEFRLKNGEQQILISSIPSEIGNSHDIIVELRKVNLGDILPYVLQEPRIEGITTGEVTIEDPLNKFRLYINAQTEQTRFEDDSIGITTLNGYYDLQKKKVSFNIQSENPDYLFDIDGGIDLSIPMKPEIGAFIDFKDTRLSVLKTYLSDVFSKIDGKATGKIAITGDANLPDLTGKLLLKQAGVEIDYTKVYYRIDDAEINLSPGLLDIGTLQLTDPLGNKGTASGTLKHHFFRDMVYDFKASSGKMLVLNTGRNDNDLFYGKALARVNFRFTGTEDKMNMSIKGSAVDTSNITILTSGSVSKQSDQVDYIRWREYGREMNPDSLDFLGSNLTMDFDLTATPLLKMNVILDPLTGDSITATGSGNLKIFTGTNEALTMNGRYTIDQGAYNFNFQDIFNKPFTIEQNSGSYLSWTGDPYNADININARYLAEKVRMSTLFESSNTSGISSANSDVLREISDVMVNCNLTGTLNAPNTRFEILLPPNSPAKNNPTIENKIKSINRDQNEVSKQSTYLIVFKSFAPQAAIVTSGLNQELLNNTISGVINSILSNSVQNFFYKLFGSSVDVNFNYSRVAMNLGGTNTSTGNQNTRENVSLEFIKSLLNNRLIITFGSDFNFNAVGSAAISNQNFLFLPDVNVEYKITPDGKLRTSFFYRSSFDVLSSSGRRERTGGNLSYRTEFDHIFNSRRRRQDETDSMQ